MCHFRFLLLCLAGTALLAGASARADEDGSGTKPLTASETDLFESAIRPVLVRHCYECHSQKAGESEGGLTLDSRNATRQGGDRGPAVIPGDAEGSLIMAAITHADPDLEMPPSKPKLPASVIADFRKWISLGAPDPRNEASQGNPSLDDSSSNGDTDGKTHWAYQKVVDPPLPEVADRDWARQPLDRFVLARLESGGLSPSPDAEAVTLIRRIHFDLVGLPPSPDRIAHFVEQAAQTGVDSALEREVDRLLHSPRYGERWGRHWLDVARFAESSGKETNVTFPHAWRYRNYVIDAFTKDLPYDQFLTEQIAGDLLESEDDAVRQQRLIATGFLAIGPKGLNEMNPLQFLADNIDEQIGALTQATIASTVACARCHDHKDDPFTMRDYYALAGIFASTKTHFGTSVAPGNQNGGDLLVLPQSIEQVIPNPSLSAKQNAKLRADLAALKQESIDRKAAAMQAALRGDDPSEFFSLQDALRIIWRTGSIEGKLKTVDDDGRALPLAMGTVDLDVPTDVPVLNRGEIGQPGETVPRGFPTLVTVSRKHAVDPTQSGRLQLANWLTDPGHPLTSRVMANRVWSHLLGSGIVGTVDNFGAEGDRPSHPQLLDHLATRFVQDGWSIKSLIRSIVLSRTYRQSSTYQEQPFLADPENRLHWRHSKRRLDAESIRDAMLFVSGDLDLRRPESSLIATIGDKPVSLITLDKRVSPDLDGTYHRSVYLPVVRDQLPDVLDLFDFASPSLVTGDRQTTNVPLQALFLMNSEFVQQRSDRLAKRVSDRHSGIDQQIRSLFVACFGREPDSSERALGREYLRSNSLDGYCQALLITAEFRNVD